MLELISILAVAMLAQSTCFIFTRLVLGKSHQLQMAEKSGCTCSMASHLRKELVTSKNRKPPFAALTCAQRNSRCDKLRVYADSMTNGGDKDRWLKFIEEQRQYTHQIEHAKVNADIKQSAGSSAVQVANELLAGDDPNEPMDGPTEVPAKEEPPTKRSRTDQGVASGASGGDERARRLAETIPNLKAMC